MQQDTQIAAMIYVSKQSHACASNDLKECFRVNTTWDEKAGNIRVEQYSKHVSCTALTVQCFVDAMRAHASYNLKEWFRVKTTWDERAGNIKMEQYSNHVSCNAFIYNCLLMLGLFFSW